MTRADIEHRYGHGGDGRVTHKSQRVLTHTACDGCDCSATCWAAAPYRVYASWDGWVRTPSTANQAPTWGLVRRELSGAHETGARPAGGAVARAARGEVVPVRVVVPTRAMPTREVQRRAVPTTRRGWHRRAWCWRWRCPRGQSTNDENCKRGDIVSARRA